MIRSKYLIGLLMGLGLASSLYAQVTLPTGVTVPKDKFIVFLFGGSCNMSGRTGDGISTTNPRLWAIPASNSSTWVPLKDNIFKNSSGAGPAVPYMEELLSRYPNYYFGVIQVSNSFAALRKSAPGNAFYKKGCAWYDWLMGDAKLVASKVTFGGIYSSLGVAEGENASTVTTYIASFATDFKMMVDSMRSELNLAPNRFPAFQEEIMHESSLSGNLSMNLAGVKELWNQALKIPTILSNSASVSTIGIPVAQSTHHYNHAQFTTLGRRWVDTLQKKHFDFWATDVATKTKSQAVITGVSVSPIGRAIGLTIPSGMRTSVVITRLDGSLVQRSNFEGKAGIQRIDGLVPGMYMLEMTGNGLKMNKRVMVN